MNMEWNYYFVNVDILSSQIQDILDEYGEDGWEMVSADVKDSKMQGNVRFVAFFKRQVVV